MGQRARKSRRQSTPDRAGRETPRPDVPGPARIIEWVAALGATALAAWLHLVFFRHAGGLWRDEVNLVNLATMPTLGDIWRHNEYDTSCAMLWLLVVRGWTAVSWLATDTGLRLLGLLVGLGILGVLWLNARKLLKYSVPLVAVMLIGLNATIVRYGDSVRGYGPGTLLILLEFGLIWCALRSPTPWRVALAAMGAICAVQTLYFNSVLLFAIGVAGMIVAVRRGLWRRAFMVGGIGLLAALSMLPYADTASRLNQWSMIRQVAFSGALLWSKLSGALGGPGEFMIWVWVAIVGAAIAASIAAQVRRLTPALSDDRRDLALFSGSALVLGVVAHGTLLKVLSWPTEPWYHLALLGFAALTSDAALSVVVVRPVARMARVSLVLVVAVLGLQACRTSLQTRQTNIDLVAAYLNTAVEKDDFVVVSGWVEGITFDRYYRGSAPWETTPPMDVHKLHRYDLAKKMMFEPDPIKPVRAAMEKALASGHRVWIVGDPPRLPQGARPIQLGPPPRPETGWHVGPYDVVWGFEVEYFLRHNARTVQYRSFGEHISHYEDPVLGVATGWRGGADPAAP